MGAGPLATSDKVYIAVGSIDDVNRSIGYGIWNGIVSTEEMWMYPVDWDCWTLNILRCLCLRY